VVPQRYLSEWQPERLLDRGFTKLGLTVAGGDTRQRSVFNALSSLADAKGVVVVHDGARPLVTPGLIDSVSVIPEGLVGLTTAVPVTDTIKLVEDDLIMRTLDRACLVAVQTPQAFRFDALREAHEKAASDGFLGTDDSSLVERLGGVVGVVAGSRQNLKVTYPEDLDAAAEILRNRGFD
jgi:2-C-methyl-D-erythritol 4-phosphate cytidylyltransferase